MIEELYKKENNLFQNSSWFEFQESYGRKIVDFGFAKGVKAPLFSGKSFVWIEKGPEKITEKGVVQIREQAKSENVLFVRIEPREIEKKATKELVSVLGTSLLSGQKSPKATQILDISKTEDEILAQMKPKTRYNIRLSAKKGITIRQSTDPKDVDVFYDFLLATASKDKGYAPHEKEYYKKMVEILGPKEIVKLFIAKYNSQALSGILVSFCGDVATYLHGGSSSEHRELMAPHACQWEAIKYAKSKGCMLYDFWGVAETDDPNDPWSGITKFKSGFGGEKVIFPGSFDIPINKSLYYALTGAAKIKRLVR